MRKYMVSSGRKYFLNTCITVIRFTPGSTGFGNCILGMSNLTADLHMHTKYGMIWKRISMKYSFLEFICWSEHFGNCAKRAKFV